MNYTRLLSCVVLAYLLLHAVGLAETPNPQSELRTKVSEAARLFPKEAKTSRKQLISFGEPAVPFIVEIIQSDPNLDPVKKAFLIDVIASIHGEKSDAGLVSLLSDGDPYVRGLAVSYITKRKLQAAIPHLISLLEDKAVYKTVVHTDPSSTQVVLVRDVAIEALQATTGIAVRPRGTKDEQVRAWMRWWGKQKLKTR